MGVQHLWDLLAAAGLPARIEALFGKKCAIDASFWLSHCLASESNMRYGGDVVGVFFLRICYLLEKGIKPIFVFDGRPPIAKRRALIKRKRLQNKRQINYNLLAFQALALQMRRSANLNAKNILDKNPTGSKHKKIILALEDRVNDTCVPKDFDFLENENADIVTFVNDYMDKNTYESFGSIKDIKIRNLGDSPRSCTSNGLFEDGYCNGDSVSFEIKPNEGDTSIESALKPSMIFNSEDSYHKLSDKMKYEVMNQIREVSRADARAKSIELKESISDYSKHQVESYIKDVTIVKEIEKLKQNMTIHIPNTIQDKSHHSTSNILLVDEIYDYNSINFNRIKKKKKFMNNLNSIVPSVFSPTKTEFPQKTVPINDTIDESVFATDEEIFGDLISGESGSDNLYSFCMKKSDPDDEFEVIDSLEMHGHNFCDIATTNNTDPQVSELSLSKDLMVKDEHFSHDGGEGSEESYMIYPKLSCTKKSNQDGSENDYEARYHPYVGPLQELSMRNTFTGIGKSTIIQDHHDGIQKILKLFGIPYIVAPSEAESQCAHLNKSGVCYAVITDDSDTLVFGAHRVLKNFYNSNIFEVYTSERLFSQLGIGRKELALIAIICGCDYTTGIKGIGIINALEVIKAYPTFDDLYEFRKWATSDCSLETAVLDSCPLRKAYKEAHINYRVHWSFSPDFPNREAYNLFLYPNVTDEFDLSWNTPNIPELLMFMEQNSSLPRGEVECCINALMTKKSQQFIIEDIMPEIHSKNDALSSLKHVRKTLNTNLSSFRKFASNLNQNSGSKRPIYVRDPNYYVSKIKSKRMLNSIISIKERSLKSKCSDSSQLLESP